MIKCSWLTAHPFLCRPMIRSRHSSLYKPPIFSPGSGPAQTPEIPLSRRVGPSPAEREREGDTWPGGCNLSIARTRDTDTPVTNCQAECGSDLLWFFGKAFPFQLPKPGWRGRDTIITGISCAGHNSNTCGEHFQVTNILQ